MQLANVATAQEATQNTPTAIANYKSGYFFQVYAKASDGSCNDRIAQLIGLP